MDKNKTTIALAIAFLALGGLWFGTRDSQPKVGVKTLAVPAIAKDTVEKVTITLPHTEAGESPSVVVLTRDGSGFVVTDDKDSSKKFPVEQSQLDGLLDAIAEFSPGDRIGSDASKLDEFEISDGKALRVAVNAKGGKSIDLLFGRAAKSGGTTVRQANSNDVFVAKGRLGAVAKKDLSQWRKKSIVEKKPEDFSSIEIKRADGGVLVATGKTEETPPAEGAEDAQPTKKTTWSLTTPAELPPGFRLDEGAVGRFAQSLSSLRAADFADGVSDEAAGFAAAHTVVTGTLVAGGSVVVHLGSVDDKKRVHARFDGDKQVYLLPEYAAKNLEKSLDDVRDLSLFSAKLDDVERATFTSGKTKVIVARDAGAWKLIEPKTPPPELDLGQIQSAIGGALRLRGARFVADVKDQGGSDPMVEIVLKDKKTQSVRFGKKAEGEGNDVLVRGGDGQLYAIGTYQKDRYAKPVELFKKPPPPPQGMGGMGGMGGMNGLENLPPDVRKKLEASLKAQGLN